jgi:heterodisulfide reductase subunit A
MKKEKIGVYICHCGGNISDYVNVDHVREAVKNEPGVVIAKTLMFTCSDSAQKEISEDIKSENLDAMVVASCSPKLHLYTFRNVAERSGLNPYNYIQCNIREQCSWAHSDKPKEATEKAIRLLRASIAKARYSEAIEPIKISALNSVLIIGAGVSGMRAAIELADMGTEVYLIEKDHFVGGRATQIDDLFTTNEKGKAIIDKLYKEIKKREKITLFTGAELESVSDSVGNLKAKVKIHPRYIIPPNTQEAKDKLKEAINKCSDQVPDEFNFGLTKRKAIYKKYEGALPDIPVVDKDVFNHGEDFLATYKDCIDLNQKSEILNLTVGAIILSTGFDPYEPGEDEFGYKKIDNVITLQQFKRIIELNSNNQLVYRGKKIKNIVFIYCVGSRQVDGENKYCSRFCCTAAVHTSLTVNKKFQNIKSVHLFRDIRTYGKQEILYDEACRQGDIFLKYDATEPPVVEKNKGSTTVRIKDILSERDEIEIDTDLVVLVTGMVPRKDSDNIASIVKAPVGRDKFFNEIHPKLRPVETVIDGLYIAGTCQGPKNITESVKSSLSASAKAHSLLSKGEIELEPIVAKVNEDICEWCDKCAAVCDYDAIIKKEYNGKAVAAVNQVVCKGGGMCVSVCPVDAIDLAGYTNEEIESMISAMAMKSDIKSKEKAPAQQSETEDSPQQSEAKMKELPEIWKSILKTLEAEQKNIPQIAKETNLPLPVITYNLMTLVKYGYINPGEMDENDEYYFYKIK